MHVDYSYFDEEEQITKYSRGKTYKMASYEVSTGSLILYDYEYNRTKISNILTIDFCNEN